MAWVKVTRTPFPKQSKTVKALHLEWQYLISNFTATPAIALNQQIKLETMFHSMFHPVEEEMGSYTSFLSCLRCRGHLANALQCCPAHRHVCHCTHPESGLLYVLRGMSLKREELCPTIQCTRCNIYCKMYKAHRLPYVYHHVCSSLHTCKLTDCSIRNYVVLNLCGFDP